MDSSIHRKPLTPRQERFCHYFVLYACASVAAKEAGYSPKSSKHQGYRLLRTGRVRDRIQVPADIGEDEAKRLALESTKVQPHLDGKEIRQVVYVPGRLVNVVVG